MKGILRRIKPICLIAVFCLMGWGLWVLRDKLGDALMTADRSMLLGAAVVAGIYLLLNASVWGLILKMVKPNVSRFAAARLWISCEAMRWLPGGIWGYATRVVEAKKLGVKRGAAGFSLAIELVITVAAWGTLGMVAALVSPSLREVGLSYLSKLHLPVGLLVGAPVLAVLGAGLVIATDLFGVRSLLMRSCGDLIRGLLRWKITLRAFFEYLVLSVFYSVGFLFCLKAIGVEPCPSLIDAAGSYGIAWIVGFVAIGAPGGMGVREGFLFLVFDGMGIGAEVVTAAILWRAIQIAVELFFLVLIKLSPSPSADGELVIDATQPS